MLLWLGACAEPDACGAMCVAAQTRFEACLGERGLAWGDAVGYADARDYADWCGTWAWEARLLEEEATCAEKKAVFEDGDCADYDAAWSEE